ncbi:molybdate transport system ATP-binding protein [Algoriphagus faecimaris]|uniref:Molybdate transport system ATP-binding protein n=1 Tax=Algoriphagus faecimaris TaxID=686796 RepID=A0A1G6RVS0_9BACT|nr:ATP-binding cassette domain-containing protein [Algoriphagus faecimaris]SDD08760.1 molybdate transport system ATP-binding protein [Algoriphagus faecimaris]
MSQNLLEIRQCKIAYKGKQAFDQLSFSWERGQCWAIISASGWLQTAFIETLRGNSVVFSGQISRPFAMDYLEEKSQKKEVNSFRDLMAYVSQAYTFKNKSNLQNFYFQQRFNSSESDEASTVKEYLEDCLGEKKGVWTLASVMELLDLKALKDESLLKLSNGESRRLNLAGGLLKQPKIFLMDYPMTGLDKTTRNNFGGLIKKIQEAGVHVLLTTSAEDIPDGVSHIAELDSRGVSQIWLSNEFPQEPAYQVKKSWDWSLLNELLPPSPSDHQVLVDLRQVSISYGGKKVLDRINWKINPGEKWQLKGPNGSGKSTLISILIGENPQAYSQSIYLFGRKRGTGESIWDIKRPIGFVAPELARFFPANQTCEKVILSGFFDTMGLFKKPTEQQKNLASKWMQFFDLEEEATLLFKSLSLEKMRWALLARALIKKPDLLILDEASQGLDSMQRQLFKETISELSKTYSLAVIFVSHYEEDVPSIVNQTLELQAGKGVLSSKT